MTVRPLLRDDRAQWNTLWEGYNAFYGRSGATALPESITESTWQRFFNPAEPVHALVAANGPRVVGLAHYVFHRSTTRLSDVCYLQDLFTAEDQRNHKNGRERGRAGGGAARAAGGGRGGGRAQAAGGAGRARGD